MYTTCPAQKLSDLYILRYEIVPLQWEAVENGSDVTAT